MDIDLTDAGKKDLEAIANDVAGIEDFQERLNATNEVLAAYRNSRRIKEIYEAHAEKLKSGEMSEAMNGFYAQISEEQRGKGSDLDFTSTRTWVRKFADKVISAFRAGVEGNVEDNYNLFAMYTKAVDRMNQREEGTMLNAVHTMIAQGKGEEAVDMMSQTITAATIQFNYSNLAERLLPPDHTQFLGFAKGKVQYS